MRLAVAWRFRCFASWLYFAVQLRTWPPWEVAYCAPPFWHSRPVVKRAARLLGFRVGWSPAEVAQLQAYAATIETGA